MMRLHHHIVRCWVPVVSVVALYMHIEGRNLCKVCDAEAYKMNERKHALTRHKEELIIEQPSDPHAVRSRTYTHVCCWPIMKSWFVTVAQQTNCGYEAVEFTPCFNAPNNVIKVV